MRSALQASFYWALWILTATIAGAQTNSNAPTTPAPALQIPNGPIAIGISSGWFAGGGPPSSNIKIEPYSAEIVRRQEQTLADGTHIAATTSTEKIYHDSQGRSRIERSFALPSGALGSPANFVEIIDPVAGYRYSLDERRRQVRRMQWPPGGRAPNPALNVTVHPASTASQLRTGESVSFALNTVRPGSATASQQNQRQIQRESLGTQIIGGVPAEGHRITMILPVGSVGNDRPITTVSETWYSKELGLVVLSKSSDPRYGDSTTEVTNIEIGEPDPALFQVPPDYAIVDQK